MIFNKNQTDKFIITALRETADRIESGEATYYGFEDRTEINESLMPVRIIEIKVTPVFATELKK